jgi:hypothetical protein
MGVKSQRAYNFGGANALDWSFDQIRLKASVFDSGAPPIRYLSSKPVSLVPDRQDRFDGRFENLSSSGSNNSGLPQPWLIYALTGGQR